MRKILAIAIVLAMVIPASMAAQTVNVNYTQVTSQLEVIEGNIDAGNITFDTEAHKQMFLSGINSVYNHRDAENWSTCATLLSGLATYAESWIVDETVAGNVKVVCNCESAVYDDYYDVLTSVWLEDGLLDQVANNTDENYPLINPLDDGLPDYFHDPDCKAYLDISTYNQI